MLAKIPGLYLWKELMSISIHLTLILIHFAVLHNCTIAINLELLRSTSYISPYTSQSKPTFFVMITGSVTLLSSRKLSGLLGDRLGLKLPTSTKYIISGKVAQHLGAPIYPIKVKIINIHIIEFWALSKIIPFMFFFLSVMSYPCQLFFYRNVQIFILFEFIFDHFIARSKLFQWLQNKAYNPYQDFQDYHHLALDHLFTSYTLVPHGHVLPHVDLALKGLNVPLSMTKL